MSQSPATHHSSLITHHFERLYGMAGMITRSKAGGHVIVVMDVHTNDTITSLMSSTEGDASIYVSSGGGMIGGGQHSNIRNVAIAFAKEVLKHKATMQPTREFPYPGKGNVRFYLRTRDGVFSVEVAEAELAAGTHELSASFREAGNVFTEYNKAMASRK